MNTNTKLPKRQYYRLSQAATQLGCDEDYLIHLGGTEMIEIMQYAEMDYLAYPSIMYPLNHDDDPGLSELRGDFYDNPHGCFYVLCSDSIRQFELKGKERSAFFADILNPGRVLHSGRERYEAELKLINDRLGIDARFLGFRLMKPLDEDIDSDSQTEDSEFDELHPPGFAYIKIDPKNLFIQYSEVERLYRGEVKPDNLNRAKSAQAIAAEPHTKTRNTYLRTIDALGRALVGSDLSEPKAAEVVLAALARASIAPPIEARALSKYLKEARELRER